MKLDMFNIDEFVEQNRCPKVTNPIFFNFDTTPTSDGLFSYELFGVTDEDRKNIFGYIDLGGRYIHPLIWLMMEKKMGAMGALIHGYKYAIIENKKVKIVSKDAKGAETGIDFLYDHWEEIDWFNEIDDAEVDSIDKRSRYKFLKSLKKNEVFITKWLVIPPFYRAESSTNRSMGDAINKLYKELISKVNGMNLGFSVDIFGAEAKLRIQAILKDIYLSCLSPISGKNLILEKGKTEGELKGVGKNSMVRKHLLGKNVDWSGSCVITSPPNSDANTPDGKPVPFGYSAFPIATLVSMFMPFFINWIHTFLEDRLYEFQADMIYDIGKIDIGQFNDDEIKKMLKKFIKAPNNRFDIIKFKYTDKNGNPVEMAFNFNRFKNRKDWEELNYAKAERIPMTLTDLVFQAADEVLEDKHALVTRFPIDNFQNIYPAKIKILTTAKVEKEYYIEYATGSEASKKIFKNYPLIPRNGKPATVHNKFYDVMLCGNEYLASISGDYDGDMLYMRGLFTQEANQEAEKLIWSKTNMLNSMGQLSRSLSKIGKECLIGLYELTKDVE